MRKWLPDFPEYEIDSDGYVVSHKGREERIIRGHPGRYGHRTVDLRRNGETHKRYVHILVLETFVGPCPPEMECRHLDGNGGNNKLSNLEWSDHKTNCADRRRHGTGWHKLSAQLEQEIRALYDQRPRSPTGRAIRGSGFSYEELAERFGVASCRIGQIVRAGRKS